MRFSRISLAAVMLTTALSLSLTLSGCPWPRDIGAALLASPAVLQFGGDTTAIDLEISKNYSLTSTGPITAVTDAPWITVGDCDSVADECYSQGPLNKLIVPVTVDRSRMRLGANEGVIVVRASGASIVSVPVFAEDLLQADFSADIRNANMNQPVTFRDLSLSTLAGDPIIGRLWNFGDGTTSTATNPVHTYARSGVFNVSLKISTATQAETLERPAFVTVAAPQGKVDFLASATDILEGDTVTFTDISTFPASAVTRRLWQFGDGAASTALNPTRQYAQAGAYTVSLTLTTAEDSFTETKTNLIIAKAKVGPRVNFALSEVNPFVDVPVQFTNLSDPGSSPIKSVFWDFGDGAGSQESNPFHTYRAIGNYTAKLTVFTNHGNDSKTVSVKVVNVPPSADFVASSVNPSLFDTVQFVDRSAPGSVPIENWAWTFGDGATSTDQNPTHRYTRNGVYTVSLTVTTGATENNTSTATKKAFITAIAPPAPGFRFTPASVFVNSDVQFVNTTIVGDEPGIAYGWDFDDPGSGTSNTSAQRDPIHRFTSPGTYRVTLTATTPTRAKSVTNSVTVDKAPAADFSATPLMGLVGETIEFMDATDYGTSTIAGQLLTFGDGSQSTAVDTQHVYTAAGDYTVELIVNYAHSVSGEAFTETEKKQSYVSITEAVAPSADFSADRTLAITGTPIQFMDLSTSGSRPITDWLWDFGDGITSTDPEPMHVYTAPGAYTVILTVTTSAPAPDNTSTRTQSAYISIRESTPLDDFVRAPDPAYGYGLDSSFTVSAGPGLPNLDVSALQMTSQTWRTADEIQDGLLWVHNLTIMVPENRASDTAVLFISGGNRFDTPPGPNDLDPAMAQLAISAGTVVALLENVPSQPITFTDERDIRSRTEDAIIAYSFDKYLQSFDEGNPDPTWPLLFAMAKAAVRGMDTVQDFMMDKGAIDDFVVMGASKRGWTTWLTAATDFRVRAIAPLVIDVLNIDEQMAHHRAVYGYWSPSIYEYAEKKVFDRIAPASGAVDAAAEALLELVDPFSYVERLSMPKYLVNSTGDQFFLPDSSQFYFGALQQEKRLNYIPNTDHGLSPNDAANNVVADLAAWLLALVQDVPRPEVNWNFRADGAIEVTTSETPVEVQLWQADSANARDFRKERIGPAWTSTTLTAEPGGSYVGQVAEPAQGWRAYYVQVRFANDAQIRIDGVPTPNLTFTSGVRVSPNVLPDLRGRRQTINGVTVLSLYGDAFTMGFDYGQLMSTEITSYIPQYLAAAQAANPGVLTNQVLDDAWAALGPRMDPRITDEIEGIANGALMAVGIVRRAHMAQILETQQYSASAIGAWDGATSTGRTLQGYALNGPMDRMTQNNPVVVVYTPDVGFPHAIVTSAGFAFGHTGINLDGISVAELDDGASTNNLLGARLHTLPLFREVLYESAGLRQALSILDDSPVTREQHILLGDGRNERRGAKSIVDPSRPPTTVFDNDITDEFSPDVLEGVVYAGNQAAGIFNFADANHGSLNDGGAATPGSLLALVPTLGAAGENLLNVIYNNYFLDIYVAVANGNQEASTQPFNRVNIQSLIPPLGVFERGLPANTP